MMNVYIYIFTGKVLNGTPNIFTNSQYHCWYEDSRNQFSPVLINTTHENSHFKIKLKGTFLSLEQFIRKKYIIMT